MNTRYIDVKTQLGYFGTAKHHESISMRSLCQDTWDGHRRQGFIPIDSDKAAQIQVGRNYGNCLFMSREGGNKLYLALKKGVIDRTLTGFDLLAAMRQFLNDNGIPFTVHCSEP